ncbi:MAG: aminotransferase class IV [Candidatus Portnoybacteria bacterium]|nr:aminotransferase class IV [Candidatus Portnoybacteria bacterium]
MPKYCYLNGKVIPEEKAKVSINDIGLLRGYGVFDYLRTYNGKPFLLNEHLARFEKSAKSLNLKVPASKKEVGNIILSLLAKNKIEDAAIRIVLTGGESQNGITCDYDCPTFFITTKELPECPPHIYEKGVKMITCEHQREKPEAKSNNYATMMSLMGLKEKKKAFEILYTSKGFVLEGATCNFFIFKNNSLITAKENILHGTRRGLILKLAKNKFKVIERPLKLKEALGASEAFISSTSRGIVPVVKIDDNKIGNGKVGENTRYLMNIFWEYINKVNK